VTAEEVFEGQTVDVRHRKDWSAFTVAWRRLGRDAPDFGIADAFRVNVGGVNLSPYERRLRDAAALGSVATLRQARALVRRRVRRLHLRRALSPTHLAARAGRFIWACLMRFPRSRRNLSVERITFFGAHFARNLGGASVICGARNALSREFPDARFTLMGPETDVDTEESLSARYGVSVVTAGRLASHKSLLVSALLWRLTRLRVGTPKALRVMRLLLESDVVVDVAGILFADSLGTNSVRYRLGEGGHALAARLLGKPVIKYTSAFGPCRTKWNRRFARFGLQECYDLLLARDERSLQEVRRIGVTTDGMVCPDSGFLFEDASSDDSARLAGVRATRPVVGLSLSYRAQLQAAEPEAYLAAMEQLARHCIEEHGAHVVLIPNEMHADRRDDMDAARMVHDRVASPHCEVLLADRMAPDELKGVVRECDVVVAARYHTLVAALSLGVPVLAVAWHHKYREVLRLFHQEGHVCDVGCCTRAGITGMFDALWHARSAARQDILAALPAVKEQVQQGARRTAEVLRQL
jgi:colanic acid/amylovoran biosynthesis protein